ncbi:MAG: glycosyltransferase [Candidatus Heimdallarchaeota archaeon]|nr:MAG: glycosyltransferase [Candidatus Heimdallarchaeota archaeon]
MLKEFIVGVYLTVIFLLNIWALNFLYIFFRFLLICLKNGPFNFNLPTDYFPMVTIQLPIYNERPDMIRLILESIYCQSYPKNKIEIVILDQSDDKEIIEALKKVVSEFRRRTLMRVSLVFVDRFGTPTDTSTQFKAGSLNIATQISHGDIFVVIDGDSYLDPHYLRNIVPHYSRKEIGLVLPRVVVHRRHKDIFARWVRITNHCYFIRNFIESVVGIPVGFLGSGVSLRREVAEQFCWDTTQEDGCMGYYATAVGKWRVWFESKAVVFDEGIIYSLKDGKKKWARLSHGQCQIIKKMAHDSENRIQLFTNLQIVIKVVLGPLLPYLLLLLPFLMFFVFYFEISFESWIGITLTLFSLLGSTNTFFLVYMVIKYGEVSDLLYYLLLPLNSIVCLVPGVVAFTGAIFGRKRAFYRVQRVSKNIPTTDTSIKIFEACLAIFFFLLLFIFVYNTSALIFYATYLVVMVISFTNFRIPPRKPSLEFPINQQVIQSVPNPIDVA